MSNKSIQIDWINSSFMILTPLLGFIFGAWHIATSRFHFYHLFIFFIFYFATGLSITAGYHRLISHRTYQAHPLLKFIYLFFGAGAFQNSALKWCSDHRVHHTHVDGPRDPYNIRRGFWYAHIGWILLHEEKLKLNSYPKDLEGDTQIMWQHRYFAPLAFFSGLILPGLVGLFLANDFWGGLLWGGPLRLVFVHHATFSINSLSHMWGYRPYSEEQTARDNYFLAFISYGEGHHNFHHVFQTDYRNGIKWYHFDPTKWLIYICSRLSLAHGLKITPEKELWKARLSTQYRRAKTRGLPLSVEERLIELRESIEHKLLQIQGWKKELNEQRRESRTDDWACELKTKLNTAKADLRHYLSLWERSLFY